MRSSLNAIFFLATSLMLAGCSSLWTVDSQVQSYSQLRDLPPNATYRFDRLPSQQAREADQSELEAMASPALSAAGLRRDDATARYAVQVSARVRASVSPWVDPWYGPGWGPGWPGVHGPGWGGWYGRGWYGPGWYGPGWYGPGWGPATNPWYDREVGLVMRELPSNQVVYETRARNSGPYHDSRDILPVMFRAALQGFPNPPQGDRRVDLPVVRPGEVPVPSPAAAPAPTAEPSAPPATVPAKP